MNKVPVFVFPVSLEIHFNIKHTHKQIIALYNPYEYAVDYKVFCTSPDNFTIFEPDGVISPQDSVDVAVRFHAHSKSQCNSNQRLRIQMFHKVSRKLIGQRDITVNIIDGLHMNAMHDNAEDIFVPPTRVSKIEERESSRAVCHHERNQHSINLLAVAVSIICSFVLLLPVHPEPIQPKSQLPECLHVTYNIKLVISFVLGLVTMLLLRP